MKISLYTLFVLGSLIFSSCSNSSSSACCVVCFGGTGNGAETRFSFGGRCRNVHVEEFEFTDVAVIVETLLSETFVGVFPLRVFVELFHIEVCRGRVLIVSGGWDGKYKVKGHLLDIFAMVT